MLKRKRPHVAIRCKKEFHPYQIRRLGYLGNSLIAWNIGGILIVGAKLTFGSSIGVIFAKIVTGREQEVLMKVNKNAASNTGAEAVKKKAKSKMSKSDVQKQIMMKFGKDFRPKKSELEPAVKPEVSAKASKKEEIAKNALVDDVPKGPGDFTNNPQSEVTKEKLKSLMSGGGFGFNDKERAVLGEILGGE